MTDGQGVWLAVMAISLVVMAVIQVGLIVAVVMLIRQISATIEQMRGEIRPLVQRLTQIADDAGRTTALIGAQVERIDQFVSVASARIEETITVVHGLVGGPVRQGAAIVMAIRAVVGAFRRHKKSSDDRRARDEDDALFVG